MNINTDELKKAGFDYEKGLNRIGGDTALYELLLKLFLEQKLIESADKALEIKNYSELFTSLHTIKGTAGNLDITELYRAACELTELLRNNSSPDDEKTALLYNRVRELYIRAENGIIASLQQ